MKGIITRDGKIIASFDIPNGSGVMIKDPHIMVDEGDWIEITNDKMSIGQRAMEVTYAPVLINNMIKENKLT
jgi:hypothetical protein